ncbi:MAG: hypothetical protein JNL66_03920 [Alphaproteobacteria bacterium]|nr:hypothetical protein [Alphaproteobacteria bacterium]
MRPICRLICAATLLWVALVPAVPARADALSELNDSFRRAYADTRAGVLAQTAPVIVCAFESLVLIDGATRREEGFTPRLYHDLKAVAHLVFAVQLLVDPALGAGPLSPASRARLEELAVRSRAVAAGLDGFGFTPAQAERQRALIAGAQAMIARALANGRPSPAELLAWLRPLVPAVMANVDDAAAAQLDGLHAVMQRWRASLGAEQWARLNVVVLGVRQARRGNLQYAYFERLLGADAVERRLIYAESVFAVDPALALLGTILTDRPAGAAFFDDPLRMERDLLADAAQRHIARLFGG